MAKGIDTTFLVHLEILETPEHQRAKAYLDSEILDKSERLALTPQVLAEFIHIVTDPRRFRQPLPMVQAHEKATFWWQAAEIDQLYPDAHSVALFLDWMQAHNLGRKRILDTFLAATYHAAGISEIITTNVRDYSVFDCFTIIKPDA